MPAILFVCTANICRSPMAMAIFINKIARLPGAAGWRVESAGTWALDGKPAATMTQIILRDWGLDLSDHRSRNIDRDLIEDFDLILTMERGHKEALRAEFPDLAERIYLLSEMVGKRRDIVDPIGGPPMEFQETARELDRILSEGFDRILQLAQPDSDKKEATSQTDA